MRLKDLWTELPVRTRRTLDDLDAQFVPTANWRAARDLYKSRSLPLLPHLGMFLTDLVFTEVLCSFKHLLSLSFSCTYARM